MTRLADGDPAAFEPVFDALWPVLCRYCTKALASDSDGEDAAQRALLKLLESAPHYDRERPALAWALGFAFWECRSERTRQRRRPTEPLQELATQLTPEGLVAQKQEHDSLMAALDELSTEERALVLNDLSPAIANATPVALRKRRQRLVERLRNACLLLLRPVRGRS